MPLLLAEEKLTGVGEGPIPLLPREGQRVLFPKAASKAAFSSHVLCTGKLGCHSAARGHIDLNRLEKNPSVGLTLDGQDNGSVGVQLGSTCKG